jgi:phage terminase small subunit
MATRKPPAGKARALNARQVRFVEEYLIDLNATQAAIRAGYSARTAQEQGSRLLCNVMVSPAIAAAMEARSKRTQITADRVLEELAKIAFSDMRAFAKWGPDGVTLKESGELHGLDAACVAEVSESTSESGGSLRFKLHSKVEALRELGRHLKLFTDLEEVTHEYKLSDADRRTAIHCILAELEHRSLLSNTQREGAANGPVPGEPVPDHGRGGDTARPVASGPPPLDL